MRSYPRSSGESINPLPPAAIELTSYRDYFSKNYGRCEVHHIWTRSSDSPQYDADGVPITLCFAIVFRFDESPNANRVKQK